MSTMLQLKAAELTSLKDIRSLIGQPLTLNIPQGEITVTGINLIREYLAEAYPQVECPPFGDNTVFQWKWLDPKEGTLPKRMAKWLKKRLRANADQQVIAHVGNLARQNSDDTQAYYFRIWDKVDWDADQFGKVGGGCWWGVGGGSRDYGKPENNSYADKFIKNDGLAIQFFRNDSYSYTNGIGRLWLYVEQDARFAATFNGYWENEGATLRLTRVLASYLGLSYKKCASLSSNVSFYINDSIGYFIGEEQALNFLHKNASYTIPKKVVYKPCSRCTIPFNETLLNEEMCTPCYNASRKRCPHCQARRDSSTFKQVRTNSGLEDWCANCTEHYADACEGCLNAYVSVRFNYPGCVKVDQVYMCTKCTMSARKCQDCGGRTLNVDAMDDPLCLKCEDLFEDEIRIPRETTDIKFVITTMGESMRLAVAESNAALRRLSHQLSHQLATNAALTPEIVEEDDCPF